MPQQIMTVHLFFIFLCLKLLLIWWEIAKLFRHRAAYPPKIIAIAPPESYQGTLKSANLITFHRSDSVK